MPKSNAEKAVRESLNLKDGQLQKLKALFPEIVADGKINWETLKVALGESLDNSFEKFTFSWAGKSEAIKNVLIPSKATLRPDKKESIDFDKSENIFVEGDNLEVLKLLQNSYFESIKMIYIDPPYNTGNDFVYKDDFKNSIKNYHEQTGQIDSNGNKLQTLTESSGRLHSDWLTMLYPRLKLAWGLLKDDGVIFVSIDDHEVHHLRLIMNEIFGEENFIAMAIWQRKQSPQPDEKNLSLMHEYICIYAKNLSRVTMSLLPRSEEALSRFQNPDNDPRGPWQSGDLSTKTQAAGHSYPVISPSGKTFLPPKGRQWGPSKSTFDRMTAEKRIWFGDDGTNAPRMKQFLSEVQPGIVPSTLWLRDQVGDNQESVRELRALGIEFESPKPVRLVRRMLEIATKPTESDLILDFFAGSATTAQAVIEQNKADNGNRKFILVQMPEPTNPKSEAHKEGYKTISEISMERIRKAIKKESGAPTKGFKVFRLSPSNYAENLFDYDPEKSEEENAKAFKSYLEKSSQQDFFKKVNELDVIYENIIKEGLNLNSKIAELKIGKSRVFEVSDDKSSLLICLDHKIDPSAVSAFRAAEYKDKTLIVFDAALEDSAKANLGLHLSLKTL